MMPSFWARRLSAPIFHHVSVAGVVLTVAALVALLAVPLFFDNAYYMRIAQQIAFYTIAAIGLNILVGYQGQVSLGHGGLFAVGAYTSALLATRLEVPVWICIVVGALFAGLIGALVALPTLRAKGPYLAMVTIAFSVIIYVVAQNWTDLTRGPEGIKSIPGVTWFGTEIRQLRTYRPFGDDAMTIGGAVAYFWVVGVAALLVQVFAGNLLSGRWGRTINAVRQSEIASETIGVSVYRWKVGAFALSAVLAGLSGAFFAHQDGYIVSDTFTFNKSVELLVYVILGGARSLFGPLIGATVLVILPEFLKTLASYEFVPEAAKPILEHYLLLYPALLILFLITMPDGMAGALKRVPGLARLLPPAMPPAERPVAALASAHASDGTTRAELVADDIKMYFGGLKAVDGVSLTVDPGHIHGLIGPNGSGKSTIVNCLTGVYRPTGGVVRLGDVVMNALPPHSIAALGVTRTFQNIQLFRDLSVLENVMMGYHLRMRCGFFGMLLRTRAAVDEEERFRQEAMNLLSFLGLAHLAEHEAQSLPYGLQRLVEIARALALDPAVLILDEPAAGVPAGEIALLSDVIRRIRDSGVTILVIEHHMDLVMGISDHVTALDYGRKIAEGTPEEIQANERVIMAYLGDKDMFALPAAEPRTESASTSNGVIAR
jgi:ABC-type branched-subunit amino acid transport system ATPase component/ABC-type branched-subunit amino acid transport system permease subunit